MGADAISALRFFCDCVYNLDMGVSDKRFLRIIDANYNRCKEGLRVVEDIFRFVYEDDRLRKQVRALRHGINKFIPLPLLARAIETRDSSADIGKAADKLEAKRGEYSDILLANLQRAKESLRVLEECFKLYNANKSVGIKKLRYKIYMVEKEVVLNYCKCKGEVF